MLASTVARFADASGDDSAAAIAGAVAAVARLRGVDADFRLDNTVVPPDPRVAAVGIEPAEVASAHLLPGALRQALLSSGERRRAGVHHTPFEVAATIVDLARPSQRFGLVADPSVGGGVFLLAVAEAMGGDPADVVAHLIGCDIDPLAVATTEAAITLWSGGVRPPSGAIRVADFLGSDPFEGQRPDLIVGNPPFLSQLKGTTVHDGRRRAELKRRWPEIGGYVDESMLFLLAACEAVVDGGTVALVQPTSVLSARHGAPGRSLLDELAPPVAFWWAAGRAFEAAVDTCAIVCRRGSRECSVRRSSGIPAVPVASCARPRPDSWSPLLAAMAGIPDVAVEGPVLSSMADVSAGFRDQYYGLRGAVVDDADGPHPLITCGLIDPLRSRWGTVSCRYDRRRWEMPTVRLDGIDGSVRDWFEQRLRPKLLVATQTRVIEIVVDTDGSMIPCTPVVVVIPHDPNTIWHLAAALCAPVTSAGVVGSVAGSGLSADAVRVSAATLAAVTLPEPGAAWDRAAELVREVHLGGGAAGHLDVLGRAAVLCDAAYGVDDEFLRGWWVQRLPARLASPEGR